MKRIALKGNQNKYLYKRGSTYWVRASMAGKPRLEKSLNTNDLVYARELRDKEILEYFNTPVADKKDYFLALDKFNEWVNRPCDWRDSTRKHIKFIWDKHLADNFGNLHLDEITGEAWLRYVEKKRLEKPDRTFANEKKYLTGFLNWCFHLGYVTRKPRFETVDKGAKEGRAYEQAEIDALLKAAGRDLKLQILCGVTMGMRKGEIITLEWAQINFDRQTIHLPKEKTKINKSRTFAISPAVFELLVARKAKSVSHWVFPSPGKPDRPIGKDGSKSAWTSCRARAGVEGTFHGLRHTFLTRAFKTATNPMLVCAYAGLSIDVAQKTYLHADEDYTREVASLVSG